MEIPLGCERKKTCHLRSEIGLDGKRWFVKTRTWRKKVVCENEDLTETKTPRDETWARHAFPSLQNGGRMCKNLQVWITWVCELVQSWNERSTSCVNWKSMRRKKHTWVALGGVKSRGVMLQSEAHTQGKWVKRAINFVCELEVNATEETHMSCLGWRVKLRRNFSKVKHTHKGNGLNERSTSCENWKSLRRKKHTWNLPRLYIMVKRTAFTWTNIMGLTVINPTGRVAQDTRFAMRNMCKTCVKKSVGLWTCKCIRWRTNLHAVKTLGRNCAMCSHITQWIHSVETHASHGICECFVRGGSEETHRSTHKTNLHAVKTLGRNCAMCSHITQRIHSVETHAGHGISECFVRGGSEETHRSTHKTNLHAVETLGRNCAMCSHITQRIHSVETHASHGICGRFACNTPPKHMSWWQCQGKSTQQFTLRVEICKAMRETLPWDFENHDCTWLTHMHSQGALNTPGQCTKSIAITAHAIIRKTMVLGCEQNKPHEKRIKPRWVTAKSVRTGKTWKIWWIVYRWKTNFVHRHENTNLRESDCCPSSRGSMFQVAMLEKQIWLHSIKRRKVTFPGKRKNTEKTWSFPWKTYFVHRHKNTNPRESDCCPSSRGSMFQVAMLEKQIWLHSIKRRFAEKPEKNLVHFRGGSWVSWMVM